MCVCVYLTQLVVSISVLSYVCQSLSQLPDRPIMVDLTIEEGQRLKVVYGSCRGFHAVDLDTMDVFDIYIPQHVCHVLFYSVLRSEGWPCALLTYFLHLSLSSVILIDSSTGSPVHVLMLSIQAVHGLPRLRAPGIVPCIISFSRQLLCFLMV